MPRAPPKCSRKTGRHIHATCMLNIPRMFVPLASCINSFDVYIFIHTPVSKLVTTYRAFVFRMTTRHGHYWVCWLPIGGKSSLNAHTASSSVERTCGWSDCKETAVFRVLRTRYAYSYTLFFVFFHCTRGILYSVRARKNNEWAAKEVFKPGNVLCDKAYLPGGGLPVVNMTGDPRGSRLLHWAMTLECCNPWRIFLRGYLYRIIFFRGGVACGPPNIYPHPNNKHLLNTTYPILNTSVAAKYVEPFIGLLGPVQTTQKLSEFFFWKSPRAFGFSIKNAVWVQTMQKLPEILSETNRKTERKARLNLVCSTNSQIQPNTRTAQCARCLFMFLLAVLSNHVIIFQIK